MLATCTALESAFVVLQACAQEIAEQVEASAGVAHFELAAQPLANALKRYGDVTGMLVGVQSGLLEGRTSAPLYGNYPPQEALRTLLAGTGLQAVFSHDDEAIIIAQSQTTPATFSPLDTADDSVIDGTDSNAAFRSYASLIQMRLTEALCRSPLTQPGNYRLVAQLRIDPTGAVAASKVVTSTGSAERDAAIARTVRGLSLDLAPPPGLLQPVTILVRPRGAGANTDCMTFTETGPGP
jgi:hypothetical protein